MTLDLPYSNTTITILWKMMNGQMPCVFRELTGLYCPGCGGTRAVKAMLKGDLVSSFLYHPLILYCVLIAVIFAISYLLWRRTKNTRFRLYLDNKYVYVGVGIIAANFIVKNCLLVFAGIDILSILPPAV